jgi:hypothetical protein
MRRLGLLCLFATASFGDRLVELASTQFVGSQTDIAAIAAGDGYLPTVLSQRDAGRGHWRSVTLGLGNVDQAKLDGQVAGLDRHGGGVVIVTRQAEELKALELRYEGSSTRSIDHGAFALGGLASPRLLRVASLREGPLLVVAHGGGLSLAAVKPRGRGRVDQIAGAGDFVAATHPVQGRDGRLSLFAVAPGRLVQLAQTGEAFALVAEHPLVLEGFAPRAIAAEGRELWIAGENSGRAILLRFDARDPKAPTGSVDLGAGTAEHLRFLGPAELAVAGTKDGRAWVGVVALGARAALAHEVSLGGTSVVALGTNPARKGWSLAAATREGAFHLLRLPGDPALPRDWNPLAPAPDAPPAPAPVEEPPPEEPLEAAPGAPRACAVLPRAEAARGGGVDTEIVLINLGDSPLRLLVRFVGDDGRGTSTRVQVDPGQRRKVSIAESLFRRGRWGRQAPDFDGYVRIEGASREDLVVDAVIRREGSPHPPEEVRPHWR